MVSEIDGSKSRVMGRGNGGSSSTMDDDIDEVLGSSIRLNGMIYV